MGKRKNTTGKNRLVYSEFGSDADGIEDEAPIEKTPAEQKILVQASRKGRKGKTVTIASGFQAQPDTLSTLLKTLKGLCGSGGTVKDMTLEIQGDHRDKIQQYLKQQGYNVR